MRNHNVPGLPPEAREVRGDGRFYGWIAEGMGGCTRVWWHDPEDRGLRTEVLAKGRDGRKWLVQIRVAAETAGLILPPGASPDPSATHAGFEPPPGKLSVTDLAIISLMVLKALKEVPSFAALPSAVRSEIQIALVEKLAEKYVK